MVIFEEQDPFSNFVMGLKAEETKRQWPGRLKMIFDFMKLEGTIEEQAQKFILKARQNIQEINDAIMRFFSYQLGRVSRNELSKNTVPNYYKALKLFCEMNDVVINWKKISRVLPKRSSAANDRAPTLEEMKRLIEYPDRRIKPIVYTTVSSGIRIGAWNDLRWKHVTPVTNDEEEILAAKIIVYPGDPEQYYSFITVEAYTALKEWKDFRSSYGEKVNGESWVMRDIWQITNVNCRAKSGLATSPKQLKSGGIRSLLRRALWEQGLRNPLPKGTKRHEWKIAHGFRKYYKSHAEQAGMKPINVVYDGTQYRYIRILL
jgi:integrase